MFIGRINEINILKKAFENPGHHSIVYGNRRIGKTTLVTKVGKDSGYKFISFECLKSSLQNNQRALERTLFDEGIFSTEMTFKDLFSLFSYLNNLKTRIILLIDEYPYLYYKNDKNDVDSLFQGIFEQASNNLNIVLSGSHIGMMKDLMKQVNPLFGRVDSIIHLSELNYVEASEFYKDLSNYEKVEFYAVFGGSPYILRQLNPKLSLKENICNTFLNSSSAIYSFVSEGYTTDLTTKDSANQLFEAIGNSKIRYNKIEELLDYDHNGLLSKQLNVLTEMEFVGKNIPINKIGDKKKTTYFIKNNALRFYFTYLYGRQNILSLIGSEAFYDKYIKQSLTTFISLRFKEIAKTYFSLLIKQGKLDDVYNIGTYYYDDSLTKTNGEFDVALEVSEGYEIIEVKLLKDQMKQSDIAREIEQILKISEIKVKNFGFVSINGFEDKVHGYKYLIEGDDLYFKKG